MKPTSLRLLAVSSLLLSMCASAATRPHYGGNLRLLMQAAPASLDPVDASNANDSAFRNIAPLIFDTLVKLDDRGAAQPALADSWQLDPANHSWQIHLRRGITFSDGLVLTPQIAAASLLAANSSWKVSASVDSISVQCGPDDEHDLPALLALPRNSIVERINGNFIGTGPFTIAKWEPAKELALAARKDYWDGRTFIDSITIEMNQTPRAQLLAFDLHQADIIEVEPDQVRRAIAEGRAVEQSKPAQLLALVFTHDSQSGGPQSEDNSKIRAALASSIDRNSLNELLQGAGSPAGGLLPNWLSGYEFVFPSALNLESARQQRNLIKGPAKLTLSYDPADRAMLLVAQRIALNARDAGITVQIFSGGAADARLVRADLISLDPRIALRGLSQTLGFPLPQFKQYSVEDLYTAENQLLQSQRVIPLLHLRTAIAIQANVHDVDEQPDGSFDLKNAWLETAQP